MKKDKTDPGLVVLAWDPSTQDVETEGLLQVQGQPELYTMNLPYTMD